MSRATVSRQSVLVSSTHLKLTTRFLLLSESCGFLDMGRPLWRDNGSAIYNCCWPSPAQSFLGPSPAGIGTIFYSLRFETSFSSPPTTRRVTVEVFDPASTQVSAFLVILGPLIILRHGQHMSRVRLRVHWSLTSTGRGANDIENTASSIVA
jgi:hypothetical protein